MQKEKFFELLGWIGMVTAILMYVFYFQQIQQNLSGGPKGNFLQPFMAGINCTFVIANVPGFIFGFLAAFSSL